MGSAFEEQVWTLPSRSLKDAFESILKEKVPLYLPVRLVVVSGVFSIGPLGPCLPLVPKNTWNLTNVLEKMAFS